MHLEKLLYPHQSQRQANEQRHLRLPAVDEDAGPAHQSIGAIRETH
ncbi:MAG TPA: hypothetical protein VH987_01060 [Candidatus Limnocylindria bacterium]|jgi:hypothetical protein